MITKNILKSKRLTDITNIDKWSAILASVFSVVFSLSIVLELSKMVDTYVLIFLSVFVVLFLIFNEQLKVKQIKEVVKGNHKALIVAFLTFTVSLVLSGIGIYFWTNKTMEIKQQAAINTTTQINEVKANYNSLINNLNAQSFEETAQYKELQSNIEYWKSRRNANVAERNENRARAEKYQAELVVARTIFNQKIQTQINEQKDLMNDEINLINTAANNNTETLSRNNFISYIFLAMIIITELVIISLNRTLAVKEKAVDKIVKTKGAELYFNTRNILKEIFLIRNVGEVVDINTVKYTLAAKKIGDTTEENWKRVKQIYNLFVLLDIINPMTILENEKPKGQIKLEEKSAMKKLDNHYEHMFSMN